MSRIAMPTLLLLALGLSASETTLGQAQVALVRAAEPSIEAAARIAETLRFDRIADAREVEAARAAMVEIEALVRGDGTAPSFVRVQALLARARAEGGDLTAVLAAQDEVLARLDRLSAALEGNAGEGLPALRAAIAAQRMLLDETGGLADRTLGQERRDLSASDIEAIDRLAQRQRGISDAVRGLTLPGLDREAARRAALEAADRIDDNRLAQAIEAQTAVLAALQQAVADPATSGAQRLAALRHVAQRQAEVQQRTAAMRALTPAEQERLLAEQRSVTQAMQREPEAGSEAQQAAAQAQAAIQAGQMQQAAAAQAQAIAALQRAQQALQAQAANGPSAPTGQASQQGQGQPAQTTTADGRRSDPSGPGWTPILGEQDRAVLIQARAEPFPPGYEEALAAYYRALAAERVR